MAKSNLPKSWEEFYAGFAQIPTEHGGRQNYRIKYILKLCAPPPGIGLNKCLTTNVQQQALSNKHLATSF